MGFFDWITNQVGRKLKYKKILNKIKSCKDTICVIELLKEAQKIEGSLDEDFVVMVKREIMTMDIKGNKENIEAFLNVSK